MVIQNSVRRGKFIQSSTVLCVVSSSISVDGNLESANCNLCHQSLKLGDYWRLTAAGISGTCRQSHSRRRAAKERHCIRNVEPDIIQHDVMKTTYQLYTV